MFGLFSLLILLNSDWINTPAEVAQKRSVQNYELQFDILNKKLTQIETVVVNIEERDNNLYRVILKLVQFQKTRRRAGFGGVNRY